MLSQETNYAELTRTEINLVLSQKPRRKVSPMWHKPICFCKSSFRLFFHLEEFLFYSAGLGIYFVHVADDFCLFSGVFVQPHSSPHPKPPFMAFQWKKNSPFSLHRIAECILAVCEKIVCFQENLDTFALRDKGETRA